jgi:NADH dehydrogenase
MGSQTRIKNNKLKILVTGSLGFVGKHLVAELKNDKSFELLCLTRENEDTSYLQNRGINYQICNLLDKISIEHHIQKSDVIIHLAAKLRSKNDDAKLKNNVESTQNIVDCCSEKQRIIFSSSTLADNPLDAYGKSKKICEEIIMDSKIPYTILRMSIVFGPNDDAYITKIIKSINSEKILPIPGNGKYIVQPVFITDVINAFKEIITKDNFTNKLLTIVSSPSSLNELINNIGKILNKKPKVHHISMTVLKPMVKIYQSFSKKPVVTKEQLVNLNSGSHSMSYDSNFPILSLDESVKLTLSNSDNL